PPVQQEEPYRPTVASKKPRYDPKPQKPEIREQKPKKEKPSTKRKRSESPEMNEADYPPEALQKPGASYVYLIYEAISNSESKRMSLSEIYRAIQRKYPYFKFRVGTN